LSHDSTSLGHFRFSLGAEDQAWAAAAATRQFHEEWHRGSKFQYIRSIVGLGVMKMAEVRLQEGESIENALRRFKRKVQTEDIIKEIKRHSFYLKPGAKRRVKQALAQQRARKKVRKEALSSNR
jgi:small subunit ribosomal protein S21